MLLYTLFRKRVLSPAGLLLHNGSSGKLGCTKWLYRLIPDQSSVYEDFHLCHTLTSTWNFNFHLLAPYVVASSCCGFNLYSFDVRVEQVLSFSHDFWPLGYTHSFACYVKCPTLAFQSPSLSADKGSFAEEHFKQ